LADHEELDLDSAEDHFRRALQVGGSHSHPARLAGSLLGEVLYERGDLAQAERLLDEGYQLGAEAGIVDFKLARYVVGARIKAVRGDRDEALHRLTEGARIAQSMALPRLAAAVDRELLRLGLAATSPRSSFPQISHPQAFHGVEAITAQISDDTLVRAHLGPTATATQVDLACRWARRWVTDLRSQGRPRALLQAQRLLLACLVRAAHIREAKALLTDLAATCAPLRMVRFLPDGGPGITQLISELGIDLREGRWLSTWASVPEPFLDEMAGVESPYQL
jgi:hypothetical protein